MATSFSSSVFTFACNHPNHLFSFSLSFIMARAPPHTTYASMVPAFSFLRMRQTADNICKIFQLIPTSYNCFQLSFHLSAVGLHNGFNWLRLPPVTCNHAHLLAVELCIDFNCFQLVATASSFLERPSLACCQIVH